MIFKNEKVNQEKSKEITNIEIIEAFSSEVNGLKHRISELESMVGKFTRAFEQLFQEEVQLRIGGKQNCWEKECSISPLERLRMR